MDTYFDGDFRRNYDAVNDPITLVYLISKLIFLIFLDNIINLLSIMKTHFCECQLKS